MRRKFCIILPVLLLATPVLFAQSKSEKQVTAAVNELSKAMLSGDSVSLARLTNDALSYGHSSGKTEDKTSFVSALASGHSDFVTLETSEQAIKIAGKAATVRYILSANIVDNGKAATVKLYVLLVWVKIKGRWQLLARQAVRA